MQYFSMMSSYGSNVLGHTYKLKGSQPFTVLGIEGYPNPEISKQYQKHLIGLSADQLIAVPYRTTLIPNITIGDGVVKLTKVAVNGQVYTRPIDISRAIGVSKAYDPRPLEKLG